MTDVLIVGATPAGLLLACELARRGLSFRLVEANEPDEACDVVLQPRSLEILSQLGLAESVLAAGQRIHRARFLIDGREQLTLGFGELRSEGTPYPFQLNVPRSDLRRILEARLLELGGRVETERLPSRYVVACAGTEPGFRFDETNTPEELTFADVRIEGVPTDEQQITLTAEGVIALYPLAGQRARIFISGQVTSFETFQSRVERALPGVGISEPATLQTRRIPHRLATEYARGSTFLCGEAAYLPSPLGGQPVNVGLQDAWNLAWKLALVLEGRAHPPLLASYHPERHPVGQFFRGMTDRLFHEAGRSSGPLSFIRRLVAPSLAKAVRGRPEFLRVVRLALSNLGVFYQVSPIVRRDAPDAREGPLPGDRAPFRPQSADRFQLRLLAAPGGPPPPVADVARELEASHPGLVDVVAEQGSPHALQLLVRPDGHVSWRASGWDVAGVRAHLAALLAESP
jgi:2-polyprenyl-6-methoxyphenol hydroxylase-like FAD-dependent oxidoreductase